MTEPLPATAAVAPAPSGGSADDERPSAFEVFGNRPFLLLWLAQAFTQIGGNMVIYGLTVIIFEATGSNTAVSFLILTFLVPAVLLSAVAGVYVDLFDRRKILIVTNILRALAFVLLFLVGGSLPLILLLNVTVSTITVFFGPAEAAMIPHLVPRRQLLAANGVFTLTQNIAFALGFALLGPVVVSIAGAPTLILLVAACYLIAAGLCWTLAPAPPSPDEAFAVDRTAGVVANTEHAIGATIEQLREGIEFIRTHTRIGWSLLYLAITASLVGVLGVLGPSFARDALDLEPKDFIVIVLPLGFGIVTGILTLNSFGHLVPRRRVIEGGMILLGILLALLASAGPLSRALQHAESRAGLDRLADVTSLLGIVVFIALLAGMCYAFVAIPSQTQLQEDLPEDVRGRVFGVLNMLVSLASFLPIIVVGPVSEWLGTTAVLIIVAAAVLIAGVASVLTRGPLRPEEVRATGGPAPAATGSGPAPAHETVHVGIGGDAGANGDEEFDPAGVPVARTRPVAASDATPDDDAGADRHGPGAVEHPATSPEGAGPA